MKKKESWVLTAVGVGAFLVGYFAGKGHLKDKFEKLEKLAERMKGKKKK